MSGDLRAILADELKQLGSELQALASPLQSGDETAAEQSLALCGRLGQAADMLQIPTLQELAIFLMSNVAAAVGAGEETNSPGDLCNCIAQCLESDTDVGRWELLRDRLCAGTWFAPMSNESAAPFVTSLAALNGAEESIPTPVPSLTWNDLALTPSRDVSLDTLRAYFAETPHLAAELSALLAGPNGDSSPQSLLVAQRLVHTIKGSSSLVGLSAVAQLAHALETALQRVVDNGCDSGARIEKLSQAADMIEALIEHATLGGEAPADLLDLIHALYESTNDAESTPHAPTSSTEAADFEQQQFADEPLVGALLNDTAAPETLAPSETTVAAEAAPTLNVSVAIIDENLRRTGELNTAIGQLAAHVSETLRRANHLTAQLARVQGQVYELETLVDTRGVPAVRQGSADANGGFDPLEMDEYTALHSLSRAFSESTLDSRELSRELAEELLKLQNLLAQHARLGRELNDSVTDTRLVPVASIAPRLERIVRQTARLTQREVVFTINGRELSIDTDILNGLVEPLMHALRNAIDHGIESAVERTRVNKPVLGKIEVDFRREGNRIEVQVRDDGRGLDFEAIARRAHQRGLLTEGRPVTERELIQCVFAPGFSTSDKVTAISGRGIGMDVVRASIERLKGTVNLTSKRGEGCALQIRLPLSLTSQHTLFVGVSDCVYGLPSTSVEQVLYSDAGRIVALGDRFAFEHGEQISPLYSLGGLLGHANASLDDIQTTARPIVLVRGDDGLVALSVDRALDSRQTVVKGLSPLLPGMTGVAGAAVLPDGGIGVILEVRELLRAPQGTQCAPYLAPTIQIGKRARRALVVDDSLSARRGLAQLLGDAGYDVTTAGDGLEALTCIETEVPDVILLDMEMPRMNGLELTAHLRGHGAWRGVPIVMITSRAAEKHRAQALRTGVTEYVTKPYQESELIDRVFALAPP